MKQLEEKEGVWYTDWNNTDIVAFNAYKCVAGDNVDAFYEISDETYETLIAQKDEAIAMMEELPMEEPPEDNIETV